MPHLDPVGWGVSPDDHKYGFGALVPRLCPGGRVGSPTTPMPTRTAP